MAKVTDLLHRRDEFVGGIFQMHERSPSKNTRGRIVWFEINHGKVVFRLEDLQQEVLLESGTHGWAETPDMKETTFSVDKNSPCLGRSRPQIDLPFGFCIIYPKTDPVSQR